LAGSFGVQGLISSLLNYPDVVIELTGQHTSSCSIELRFCCLSPYGRRRRSGRHPRLRECLEMPRARALPVQWKLHPLEISLSGGIRLRRCQTRISRAAQLFRYKGDSFVPNRFSSTHFWAWALATTTI